MIEPLVPQMPSPVVPVIVPPLLAVPLPVTTSEPELPVLLSTMPLVAPLELTDTKFRSLPPIVVLETLTAAAFVLLMVLLVPVIVSVPLLAALRPTPPDVVTMSRPLPVLLNVTAPEFDEMLTPLPLVVFTVICEPLKFVATEFVPSEMPAPDVVSMSWLPENVSEPPVTSVAWMAAAPAVFRTLLPEKVMAPPAMSSMKLPLALPPEWLTLPENVSVPAPVERASLSTARAVPVVDTVPP